MALGNLVWAEAGSNATQDTSFYSAIVGTTATATDQPGTGWKSGANTIKLSTGGTPSNAFARRAAVLADAGRQGSAAIAFDTLPNATGSAIIAFETVANAAGGFIGANASGTILFNTGAANILGSINLAVNTRYVIGWGYTIASVSSWQINIYVNNVLALSATQASGNLANATLTSLRIGMNTAWGTSRNMWVGDVAVFDGTDYSSPGLVYVTAKRPNANGSTVTFDTTTTTTNSGYGTGNSIYLNQRPLLTTGARRQNGVGTASDRYTIENATTGDLSLVGYNQLGYMAWANCSGVSTDQIYKNGSAVTPDNATISAALIYWSVTTGALYPSNTDAIGMNRGTGSATDAILNECGIVIVLVPQPSAMFLMFGQTQF